MSAENVSVVFDRRKKVESTGQGMLEIRVYLGKRVRRYYSIGKFSPRQWKKVAMSAEVVNRVRDFQKILTAMEVMGETMTIDNFNKHVEDLDASEVSEYTKDNEFNGIDQNQSFIDYMQHCVDGEELAHGTRKQKQVVIESLKVYGKIKTFADLTPKNILDYDQWLHNGTRTDVTIKGYHKRLRKYTGQLRCCNMIPADPYDQVRIKPGRCKEREPLTEDQLVAMRKLKALNDKLDRVRDLFIFSSYTGLAYCDVMDFDFYTMTVKNGKIYYIDGSRLKTHTKFFTPILKPAMDVLKKYNYKLPHISNQKANDYLKLIRTQLGIHQNLTFHVARHSFATLALSHNIPMDNVAKMLGHTNIKTTQLYAKVLKKTLENNSERLSGEIK